MKLKRKALILLIASVLTIAFCQLHVKKGYATISSITLTNPDDGYHSLDTTPAFIFQPVSDVNVTINCTLYVADVASGDVQATNDTATSITCNRTLTVAGTPYEWYINATDEDETGKSAVREIYVVPSTGPIDIPDYDDQLPDSEEQDNKGALGLAGVVAVCAIIIFVTTMFGHRKQFSRKHLRRR